MDFISQNKRYVIPSVIALIVAIVICIKSDIFALETSAEVFTVLSNACAIPGGVLFGIGIILWVTDEGLFNGISYGMKTVGRSLTARKDEKIKDEEFYEYSHPAFHSLLEIWIHTSLVRNPGRHVCREGQ